jgi:hypothetical protein
VGVEGAGRVMDIGIHQLFLDSAHYGYILPEDLVLYRELNCKWAKWPLTVSMNLTEDSAEWLDEDRRDTCDQAHSIGMEPVMDLRTSVDDLNYLSELEQFAYFDRGELTGDWEEDQRRINTVALQVLLDKIAAAVDKHRDHCANWEFWGEWLCPWVGRGQWDAMVSYPGMLCAVHRTIKAVQPEARVWLGGYGMDLTPAHILTALQHGAAHSFDVANWHPYFTSVRDLETARVIMEDAFTQARAALVEWGDDQVFAASEWGYPVHHPDVPQEVLTYLQSHVLQEGVRQLTCAEAGDWYEQDLSLMAAHGFEAVMVHCLHDYGAKHSTTRHWGTWCGLLTEDRKRKPTFEVVQRWGWKN